MFWGEHYLIRIILFCIKEVFNLIIYTDLFNFSVPLYDIISIIKLIPTLHIKLITLKQSGNTTYPSLS